MGTRAFSHDSIFIPDGQGEEEQEAQTSSQDCVVGKVKSLQQQLGKNLRFGQPPPTSMAGKRMQDPGAGIEEMDTTQHSPVEVSAERESDGNRTTKSQSSHSPRYAPEPEHKPEEKVTPVKTSRPKRPSGTIETINLDAVPMSAARLDNSAAKHKLSVKPKNQRVSKKHRGMSQDFDTIEDNENESTSNMQRYKAMYHSMDITSHDTFTPDHFQRNISDHFRSLVSEGDNKLKRNLEGKCQDHSNLKQAGEDTKHPDEEKKSEADKRKEEEEKKRQEIIRNIELERLKQKIRDEKENELKEQRRREEEKKQRAEQILKELEEYRRQEEQKQREQEEKNKLQLAEEQKKREVEIQRALQVAEEKRKQEMERQRSLQLVEEQKRNELEQKVIQTADEKKKHEVEEQKASQIAEGQTKSEAGKQKAPQIAEEIKYELGECKMLKTAEEIKNEELEEPKFKDQKYETKQQRFQKTVEQTNNEIELIRTHKTSEEQKKEQLNLGKSDQQQKNELEKCQTFQTEEQKSRVPEEPKARQFTEEQQFLTAEGQTQTKLKSNTTQLKIGGIKEELTYEELTKTEQKTLQKSGQQTDGDIMSHVLQEHHSPIKQEAVSDEKVLCQSQTIQEKLKTNEEQQNQEQQREAESEQQDRINEERRWEELDRRQKSYTFKVGEKQIIFEKVNLSPVTVSKDPVISQGVQDPKDNKVNISSHNLPSTQCIPHTAILVTGAQLCGTAVNPDEIKDTACKSLLGLTEERKLDIAEDKIEKEKKQISSKTKYSSEALENQSFLAEWSSIRSKILSKTENINVTEKSKSGSLTPTEDLPATEKSESHSSLRKTMSANAKFSITPAWQKFPEPGKTPEMSLESSVRPSSKENIAASPEKTQSKTGDRTLVVQEMVGRIKKQVTIDGNAEGWIFSKDLPSFIVPNPPQSPRRGFLETQMSLETQLSNGTLKTDKLLQGTEEKISPFGIKLRRTNYSLRFHADTQNEQKKKKRYSAGDSFEGIPTPFISADETESRTIAKQEVLDSADKVNKDNTNKVLPDASKSASDIVQVSPLVPSSSPQASSPNRDRGVPKSPVIQKPSLAPKPASPTPPSSPLSQLSKIHLSDVHGQRVDKSEKGKQTAGEVKATLSSPSHVKGLQQDVKEKPDLSSVSWREKTDKSVKDRPVFQSRHSLDSSRLIDQVETAQPLWITLALQKQKGFREQQASREERRQAREAKQADRLTKENISSVQPGEYRSRSGSLPKPLPQEEKKGDTVVTRLQRREQLQKSNTLPTSVTVEITETVPVALARDLTKRFSTPDATPASSEPTWLALAKRKSKAWSDCPQIIK